MVTPRRSGSNQNASCLAQVSDTVEAAIREADIDRDGSISLQASPCAAPHSACDTAACYKNGSGALAHRQTALLAHRCPCWKPRGSHGMLEGQPISDFMPSLQTSAVPVPQDFEALLRTGNDEVLSMFQPRLKQQS